jgi:putative transposase
MPRAPRMEFPGAIYHVMARGNRREPIVFDDDDRELFVGTLGEACEMTGWEVFAWVLMDNHYHAVFRTPTANLVEGMRWFQNAYTRRLNGRRRLWGHLFGGRYRSILIEDGEHGSDGWGDYLATAMDYVHMNPGRAGLVNGRERSSLDYRWSSLHQGYARPPSKRPVWLAGKEGMEVMGYSDTAAGRRQLVERLDEWVRDEGGSYDSGGVVLDAGEAGLVLGFGTVPGKDDESDGEAGDSQESDLPFQCNAEGPSRGGGQADHSGSVGALRRLGGGSAEQDSW